MNLYKINSLETFSSRHLVFVLKRFAKLFGSYQFARIAVWFAIFRPNPSFLRRCWCIFSEIYFRNYVEKYKKCQSHYIEFLWKVVKTSEIVWFDASPHGSTGQMNTAQERAATAARRAASEAAVKREAGSASRADGCTMDWITSRLWEWLVLGCIDADFCK